MFKIKKVALLLTVIASVFIGCGKKDEKSSVSNSVDVGIAMPTKSSPRFIFDVNIVV